MTIWIDAQISPVIALWINSHFSAKSVAIRDLGLRDAKDIEIFESAKKQNTVIMTKDDDFVSLLKRLGPPPQIIWVRCGNTSHERLIRVFENTIPKTLQLLEAGEKLVEISAD